MTRRFVLVVLIAIAGEAAAGCCDDGVRVADDLQFELFSNELHTPYVPGATVDIFFSREDGGSVLGWSLASRDQNVLRCGRNESSLDKTSYWDCLTVGPGRAEIAVVDSSGSVRATRQVEVAQPDTIMLIPAGRQKILHDQAPAWSNAAPLLVMVGGEATFEVTYTKGHQRLFGNGALGIDSDNESLPARNRLTFLLQNREWLSIDCLEPAAGTIALQVGGEKLAQLAVESARPERIDQVIIEAEDPDGVEDGQFLYLLGRAFDSIGLDIFGVNFGWQVDGVVEDGEGDLFRYSYHDGHYAQVSASAGLVSDSIRVEMSGGRVTTSNNIGCATTTGSPSLAVLLVLLAALGGLVLRSRRPAA